jgi:hypothetical protein
MAGFQNPGGSGGSTPGAPSMPQSAKFPNLHKGIARVTGGVGDTVFLFIGDSTWSGFGVATLSGSGFIPKLTSYLNSEIVNSAPGLVVPRLNLTDTADPRVTLGSGWTIPASGFGPFGVNQSWSGQGVAVAGANAAAGTLTFQPAAGTPNYDSYNVYSLNLGVASGFSVNFNGGTNTVVSGSTAGLVRTAVTGASTSRPTVNFTAPTGAGGCGIVGWEPFLSTVPTVRLGNLSVVGAAAANWNLVGTPSAAGSLAMLFSYLFLYTSAGVPVTVFIGLGLNDYNNFASISAYIANLTAIASQITSLGCDVVLVSENPELPGFLGQAQSASFWAAATSLAQSKGFGYIDVFNAWGGMPGFAILNAAPSFYTDAAEHPSLLGYNDIGRLIGQSILLL